MGSEKNSAKNKSYQYEHKYFGIIFLVRFGYSRWVDILSPSFTVEESVGFKHLSYRRLPSIMRRVYQHCLHIINLPKHNPIKGKIKGIARTWASILSVKLLSINWNNCFLFLFTNQGESGTKVKKPSTTVHLFVAGFWEKLSFHSNIARISHIVTTKMSSGLDKTIWFFLIYVGYICNYSSKN